MILDTSYFLPLARIDINSDLLLAIAEKKVSSERISLDRIGLNSISIFELQAKAAKLGVKTEYVTKAIGTISNVFKIESYSSPRIIETASILRRDLFTDYVDCVITATAIQLREDLVTEDSKILRRRGELKQKYELTILTSRDLLQPLSAR